MFKLLVLLFVKYKLILLFLKAPKIFTINEF